jgi:hypothetical protein
MNAPVFARFDIGRDYDFPGMIVRIGKISVSLECGSY